MDIQKLKRLYDAARSLNGHNQEEASVHVGKSQSMINQVLAEKATSEPTVSAILDYSYKAGLKKTAKDLGLDADHKLQTETA